MALASTVQRGWANSFLDDAGSTVDDAGSTALFFGSGADDASATRLFCRSGAAELDRGTYGIKLSR